MFQNKFRNKKILITGHTGFKGSWLSTWLLQCGAKIVGISKDIPTQPSMFKSLELKNKISHYVEDMRELESVRKIILKESPDFIFHLAAQAIVSISKENPLETISSNTVGTMNLLEVLRSYEKKCSVVFITSDKCYDNVEWVWGYKETDKLGGKDIYSGSKAAAEVILNSYLHTFFLNDHPVKIGIGRAGNVLGGGDRAFKRLVPDLIKAIKLNQDFEIRQPNSVRPWQYVLDSLLGYLYVAEENYTNSISEIYNLNSSVNNQYTAGYIVDKFNKIWGTNINIIESKDKSFKEVDILNLDSSKAKDKLNWSPKLEIEDLIELIVNWEKAHIKDIDDKYTLNEINNYFSLFN